MSKPLVTQIATKQREFLNKHGIAATHLTMDLKTVRRLISEVRGTP